MYLLPTLALLATSATAFPLFSRQSTCYSGAYVINLHGCGNSGNQQGPERAYTDAIVSGIPNSGKYALPYNGNCGLDYYNSLNSGVTALKNTLQSYSQKCPNGRIVLVGYSEGAHVAMNTLGGWQDDGTTTAPIDSAYTKNLRAVVLLGDPSHTANQSYNHGSAFADGGGFPRAPKSLENLKLYASRISEWCDKGDEYCAIYTEPEGTGVHGSYFSSDHYVNAGVSFALSKTK